VTFADLPTGALVFVANVLLYHFTNEAQFGMACTEIVERIEQMDLLGFTATHVVSEVAHRLMTIEAAQRFGRPFAGIVPWMSKHPAEVRQLTLFRQGIQEILRYGIQVLTLPTALLDSAANVSQQTGLLHNDSLTVAVMQAHGLTNLASHDTDFDCVPGLARYGPV
jgi:predicted nucleic acid-binding protein